MLSLCGFDVADDCTREFGGHSIDHFEKTNHIRVEANRLQETGENWGSKCFFLVLTYARDR